MFIIASIISFLAYAYNKYPKSIVDNARFYAPVIVMLQIWNFWSDINLCGEIFTTASMDGNVFIISSGLGVLTFILLPYLINIILAKQIRSIVRNNIACKYYFETEINPNASSLRNNKRYILFFCVMLISGSTWCSLLLLSSRMFAINMLNNGLTKYELMQFLAGPKSFYFMATYTLFSNLPQIGFQFLYCIAIEDVTYAAGVAFFTSLASMILYIFLYVLEKQKMAFYHTLEYYLEMSAVSKREFDKNDHYMFEYQRLIINKKGMNTQMFN